jgi:tRNA (guanine-N7-)-methyltransferase
MERQFPRRIKSYVTRAGRISAAQERALSEYGPALSVPYAAREVDFALVFGREAPTVVEIGFGMGETTAAIARARPDVNFLGIEVHTPGVGALMKQIVQEGLSNVRIIQHDAVEVLEHMIAPSSLAGIHIFFPDPWHKARHHKRRLIQPPFIRRVVDHLAPDGYIHCATDWEEYAVQMLAVLEGEPGLSNFADGYATAVNPLVERPRTKFEARGLRLGHGVWDLVFRRRN